MDGGTADVDSTLEDVVMGLDAADATPDVDAGCSPAPVDDAGCDPFVTVVTTTVPPGLPDAGPLIFSLLSTGCPCPAASAGLSPRSCAGWVTLSAGLTTEEECLAIAAAIDAGCGAAYAQASFASDATQCAAGTLTVRDPLCDGRTGSGGLTLALSSSASFPPGPIHPDLELDVISNGCPEQLGGGFAMLGGTPTGVSVDGKAAAVAFRVDTPDIGQVIETILTMPAMSAADIAAQAVVRANATLTAFQSQVRCQQDPRAPTLVRCSLPSPEGGANANWRVPCTFAVDDTGLARMVLSGPPGAAPAAEALIEAEGGIGSVPTFNFVGGVTCSPCDSGAGVTCCN